MDTTLSNAGPSRSPVRRSAGLAVGGRRRGVRSRLRRAAPVLFGLALYAALLGSWQGLVAPRLPAAFYRVGSRVQNMVWVEEGITPLASEGDLEAAELLFVGDSRVWRAICREAFDEDIFGPSAILWGSAARTKELLVGVEKLHPRRVVLAVSTLGFIEHEDTVVKRVFSDVEIPRWDSASFEQDVLDWRSSRLAALEAAGVPPQQYAYTLSTIEATIRETRTTRSLTPRGIDLNLSRFFDDARARAVRTLRTDSWSERWLAVPNPKRSRESYRVALRGLPLSQTHENMRDSARLLRELRARGVDIVCIRLPFDVGLRSIEDEYLPPADYARFCREAGVRYLDYSKAPFQTYDGSHLTARAAPRFSARLARDLRELFEEPLRVSSR